MLYNFKSSEGQWVVDSENLTWARTSSIISSPSLLAAEGNIGNFVPIEEGKLNPLGGGRYSLLGRRPFNEKKEPQLSIFILLTVLSAEGDGTCVTFVQGNVDLSDFQHQQIKHFKAECLPAVKAPNRPALQGMPPITKEEQKAMVEQVSAAADEAIPFNGGK